MNGARFETLEPGDELEPVTIHLAADFVRAHAIAMDMNAPRFTDEDGARAEGLPGQITPGNMSLGLLARTLLAWLPGARLERIGTTFRGLARAGGSARIQAMVTEKDEEARRVECDVWMESEGGDRLVIGTATLGFPEARER
jgi:acyl dehydratase